MSYEGYKKTMEELGLEPSTLHDPNRKLKVLARVEASEEEMLAAKEVAIAKRKEGIADGSRKPRGVVIKGGVQEEKKDE